MEPIAPKQMQSSAKTPGQGQGIGPVPNKASAFMHTMRMDSAASMQKSAVAGTPQSAATNANGLGGLGIGNKNTNTSQNTDVFKTPTNPNTTASLAKKIAPTYAEPREIPSSKDDFKSQIPTPSTKNAGLSDTTLVIDNNAEWPTYAFSAPSTSPTPPAPLTPVAPTQKPPAIKSISCPDPGKPLIPPIPPKTTSFTAKNVSPVINTPQKPSPSFTLAPTKPGTPTPVHTPAPAANINPQPAQMKKPGISVMPPISTMPKMTAEQFTAVSPFQSGIDNRLQPKEHQQQGTLASQDGKDIATINANPFKRPQNTVQTLTDDVAAQVKKGMSLADIAMAEAKHRREIGTDETLFNDAAAQNLLKKRIVFGIAGFLLLLGGVGALWIGYKRFIDVPIVAPVKVVLPPIVKSDSSENIILESVRPEDASAVMRSAVERANLPIGNIKELPLYASPTLLGREPEFEMTGKNLETQTLVNPNNLPVKLTASETLNMLSKTISPSLPRALDAEWYFGIYHNIGNNPIMIFRTNTPEIVYRDMLAWEKSQNMVKELQNIFLNTEERLKPPFFMATETGATYEFKDAVIDNRDIRVLVNTAGDIVLMYGFLDNKTLIITTNKLALREAYNRIVLGKLIR